MVKKITICASAFFIKEVLEMKKELEKHNLKVFTFPSQVMLDGKKVSVIEYYKSRKETWNKEIEKLKEKLMKDHSKRIMDSDDILVLNLDKNGKKGYIGGNVLIEMGLAFALKKKIFLINPVPEYLPYSEEIKGMRPIIIKNLEEIKNL